MSVGVVIVVLIVVAMFLALGLLLYVNWSLKKEAKDHVLCLFVTATGLYMELRPTEGNFIVPPESHIPLLKKNKKSKGKYLLPEKPVYTQWPTWGWPQAFRVEVRCALYREGNYEPIDLYGQKSNDDSAMILAYDEWAAAARVVGKQGMVGDLATATGIKPMYLWIGFGIMGLMLLILLILVWLDYSNLSNLMGLWGL